MARNEAAIDGVVTRFQQLVEQANVLPTLPEVITGWELMGQLKEASGLRDPHTSEILHALAGGTQPDHNAASLAEFGLDLVTEGFSYDNNGRLVIGLEEPQKARVLEFASVMKQAVEDLFVRE